MHQGPDWGPLIGVLDAISTITGFASFIPGPQQPILVAISGIAGAAASFIKCATGGLLSPDCIIDVVFAALGPIGKGLKTVIGPIVKQAFNGVEAVVSKAPTPKPPAPVVAEFCSFAGDTGVVMADGTTKPIEDVDVGDEVLAEDPVTGEQSGEEVTHLWVHQDDLTDLDTSAGTVTTTEDHPFWNDTDQQWQPAAELDEGDELVTATGDTLTVTRLNSGSTHSGTAYNLTVDRLHTYYVAVGNTHALVHNVCPVAPKVPLTPNQRNQAINKGQAPTGLTRVDLGKVTGEQTHIHFGSGAALNIDGTWKHGSVTLTKARMEWLRANGWNV